MGNNRSMLVDPSDSDSDSDFDYTPEPRSAVKGQTSASNKGIEADMVAQNSRDGNQQDEEATDRSKEPDLTTDAALNTLSFPKPEVVVTVDEVLRIESELEPYEMVSLVYLLYDDVHFALQELIMFLNGAQKNLLLTWANVEQNRCDKWQTKLIEALCVIKQYEILKSLGYNKQDLVWHFLPHRANTITLLNKTKKALYLVAEQLNVLKTNAFLQQVRLDFQKANKSFDEFDPEYLEIFLLKWEVTKYISTTDVSNVLRVLKVMDEELLYDMLSSAVPQATPEVTSPAPKNELEVTRPPKLRQLSTSTDTHQLQSGSSREGFDEYRSPLPSIRQDNVDDDNSYKIDPENPGLVLIVNQEHFYTEVDKQYKDLLPKDIDKNKLESRKGSGKDRDDLKNIFERYGFTVVLRENLVHTDLIAEIKTVVKSVRNESSLFVCIMSHGDKGVVYGGNSCEVKISQIQEIMCRTNKEHLKNKPKILILQSCQGKQCQQILEEDSEDEPDDEFSHTTDGQGSSKLAVPRTADMLTFWATVPGYAAIRNKRTGSWFIQALCNKMEQLGNRHHFADICTRIVRDVTGKTWTVDKRSKNAMTPLIETTLRRDFYLPPIRGVSP